MICSISGLPALVKSSVMQIENTPRPVFVGREKGDYRSLLQILERV